jgi:sugar-specific transcriptional regulator TrmB
MENELLKDIGLSAWESQSYMALLELGQTTTGPLVKKSEVPQSKIYGVLESLIKKGLVSYIVKGQIKYFQASSPKRILDLFKEKEKQVESLLKDLEQRQKQEKHSVELFEGTRAIKAMLMGIIENAKSEDWYGFSTGKTSLSPEIEDFYEWWGAQKQIAGLKDHLLISSENKEEFLRSIEKESLPAIRKILKFSKVSFPGDTAIFRNQVIIFNWENISTATLISNKSLAEEYKDFFLGLWKFAKK